MIISLPMQIHYLVFVLSYFGFLYYVLCNRTYIDSTISLVAAKIREKTIQHSGDQILSQMLQGLWGIT